MDKEEILDLFSDPKRLAELVISASREKIDNLAEADLSTVDLNISKSAVKQYEQAAKNSGFMIEVHHGVQPTDRFTGVPIDNEHLVPATITAPPGVTDFSAYWDAWRKLPDNGWARIKELSK